MSTLGIEEDELVACVSCGLCLPHCPTWRVTGEESASPRGRIAAMRAVESGAIGLAGEFSQYMKLCVQCRACEAVCPSSVPFGRMMEATRATLATQTRFVPRWQRLAYRLLTRHRVLVALSRIGAVMQRLHVVPRRLGLPRLPVRSKPLQPTGDDVWLFTGCVMDAWQRDVHAAVIRVLAATGTGTALPDSQRAACCGALHVHAGLVEHAQALARRTMSAFPGDAPILVDSAGCGAALKDYGHLLGTDEALRFSARVRDVHEWLAKRVDTLPKPASVRVSVAVHDACHLRHVQKAHDAVRTVLAPFVEVRELDDEGLCCGAGGVYAALHPDMAASIRARKLASIERTGAPVVASANPGCTFHLVSAGVDVRHPMEIVDDAIAAR